jgi:hypothetical protein
MMGPTPSGETICCENALVKDKPGKELALRLSHLPPDLLGLEMWVRAGKLNVIGQDRSIFSGRNKVFSEYLSDD